MDFHSVAPSWLRGETTLASLFPHLCSSWLLPNPSFFKPTHCNSLSLRWDPFSLSYCHFPTQLSPLPHPSFLSKLPHRQLTTTLIHTQRGTLYQMGSMLLSVVFTHFIWCSSISSLTILFLENTFACMGFQAHTAQTSLHLIVAAPSSSYHTSPFFFFPSGSLCSLSSLKASVAYSTPPRQRPLPC